MQRSGLQAWAYTTSYQSHITLATTTKHNNNITMHLFNNTNYHTKLIPTGPFQGISDNASALEAAKKHGQIFGPNTIKRQTKNHSHSWSSNSKSVLAKKLGLLS